MDFSVVKPDHIIVKEIEKRKTFLAEVDDKRIELARFIELCDRLKAEIADADANKEQIYGEINELTECAFALGIYEKIQPEEVEAEQTAEQYNTDESY